MQAVSVEERISAAPGAFGDEFKALLSGSGIYRLQKAVFSLTGSDRVRWLNGMVTNNVRDLGEGSGVYAFLLNPQGHIQAALYAFHRGESLLVETERNQAETVLQIFDRYIIMDDVTVENIAEKFAFFGVSGPDAVRVLANLSLDTRLESLQISDATWSDATVSVVRKDNPLVPSFELWAPTEVTGTLWDALLQAGAREVHSEALEALRILSGAPKIGQDIRQRDLPQETGQERALNFSKGCYIGQEIVERIRSRGAVHRLFYGFLVEGPLPSPGVKIQAEGKDVGEITSSVVLPLRDGDRAVALGYLRKEFLHNQELRAGAARVRAVGLPFYGIV